MLRPHPNGRRHLRARAVLLAMSLTLIPAAHAGPDWEEPPIGSTGDAGELPSTAQIPKGDGTIARLSGRLDGFGEGLGSDMPDFRDMYLIRVVSVEDFKVSTSPLDGGAANFETSLFLFDIDGAPQLANILTPNGGPGSLILPNATDQTEFTLPGPGLYYIAVSGVPSVPTGPVGGPPELFLFASATEISGPDGPGGSSIIGGWIKQGQTGDYAIDLRGVAFAAPPCPGDLNADGIIDALDLSILLSVFGQSGFGDLNNDAIIDALDLGILLGAFGQQCITP